MLKTKANPADCRSARLTTSAPASPRPLAILQGLDYPFFGANRKGHKVTQGCGTRSGSRDAGRSQERTRFHQSLLRDGFHRGPEEVDVPTLVIHAMTIRSCRSRLRHALVETRQERDAEDLSGCPHGLADTHKDQLTPICLPSSRVDLALHGGGCQRFCASY